MRCDLYVGNLDFAEDLFESIHPWLERTRMQLGTTPSRKSWNSRYGFIELSSGRNSPIDPEDICVSLSGMVNQVKVTNIPV